MKKGVLFIFFAAMILAARSQVISYNLATIPDSIKKDAKVIVQSENQIFKIEDINDASLYVHKIYTVVNEDGKDELDFYVTTTKFISLSDAEIKVYDANGKQISKHKKKSCRYCFPFCFRQTKCSCFLHFMTKICGHTICRSNTSRNYLIA